MQSNAYVHWVLVSCKWKVICAGQMQATVSGDNKEHGSMSGIGISGTERRAFFFVFVRRGQLVKMFQTAKNRSRCLKQTHQGIYFYVNIQPYFNIYIYDEFVCLFVCLPLRKMMVVADKISAFIAASPGQKHYNTKDYIKDIISAISSQ